MSSHPTTRLTVTTRGSALALRQTAIVVDLLQRRHPSLEIEVRTIQTPGDRNQRDRISSIGDKGVFVRTLEQALLDGSADFAVHSLKDVPSDVEVDGLTLAAFVERDDPRDAVVSSVGTGLCSLPNGSRIGTSSLRRRAQVFDMRSDLEVLEIRGNVDTRLRKLDEGQYDAIILAAAGLRRLGLDGRISQFLAVDEFVPDAGQGIIAVQTRGGAAAEEFVRAIDDPDSRTAATAERAGVRALGADCHSPVGFFARIEGDTLDLFGMAAGEDCRTVVRQTACGSRDEAQHLGESLGSELKRRLASAYLY